MIGLFIQAFHLCAGRFVDPEKQHIWTYWQSPTLPSIVSSITNSWKSWVLNVPVRQAMSSHPCMEIEATAR